jgi:hypothetical protein
LNSEGRYAPPAYDRRAQQSQTFLQLTGDDLCDPRDDEYVSQIGVGVLTLGSRLPHVPVMRVLWALVTRQMPFAQNVNKDLAHGPRELDPADRYDEVGAIGVWHDCRVVQDLLKGRLNFGRWAARFRVLMFAMFSMRLTAVE